MYEYHRGMKQSHVIVIYHIQGRRAWWGSFMILRTCLHRDCAHRRRPYLNEIRLGWLAHPMGGLNIRWEKVPA